MPTLRAQNLWRRSGGTPGAYQTQPTPPAALNLRFAYDPTGQRLGVFDPSGGVELSYYDAGGRLASIQNFDHLVTTNSYDALNRLTTEMYANGLLRATTYDNVGNITQIQETQWPYTLLHLVTATYDPAGNKLTTMDLAGNSSNYVYDVKNRLMRDTTTGPQAHTYQYTYDPVDNRLTSNESGTLTSFIYDAAARLVTATVGASVTTYTYSIYGNMTGVNETAGLTTMSYDVENRLKVHQNLANVATYAYTGDGLKRTEMVNGILTTIV